MLKVPFILSGFTFVKGCFASNAIFFCIKSRFRRTLVILSFSKKLLNQIGAVNLGKSLLDIPAFFRLVPKKELFLVLLFSLFGFWP